MPNGDAFPRCCKKPKRLLRKSKGKKYQNSSEAETAQNGLSMNFHLHYWFDNAKFALKPLRRTDNSITVQWHWLKPSIFGGPKELIEHE